MLTVVPVNAELTVMVTPAHGLAAGVPVLLSPAVTEYVLVVVSAPVERVEAVCPVIGVLQVNPLYH